MGHLSRRLVWVAGLILVMLGIVSLYLSDAVAQGWWQGTSQALGVGFIVAGVVDVLAISGLQGIVQSEDRRINNQARWLLRRPSGDGETVGFICAHQAQLDPEILESFERWNEVTMRNHDLRAAESPDRGEAP